MTRELEEVAQAICKDKKLIFNNFVGDGAYKETYHVFLDCDSLALKIFRKGLPNERIEREIEAMMVCNHPNISKLLDFGHFIYKQDSYLYITEEFFEGGTLTSRISSKCFSSTELKQLAQSLIEAISHMASNGLVHRDLKPDNIMFRDNNISPVILDFGLVRNLAKLSLTQTWLMQGPGTPYFAAPEQLNNQKELIDWRTDQFSLGVILSFCIFGIHPYAHSNDNMYDVVTRVANREEVSSIFAKHCAECKLIQLITMVAPWPISRFRTPYHLLNEWN